MNLLIAENITKSYGDDILLDNITLSVNEGDKIGLIGVNGTGKSTLLKIIAGLEYTDSGEVHSGNQVRVEYLSQNPEFDQDLTILEQVIKTSSKMQEVNEYEAKSILNQLGIRDFHQKLSVLSGGEKKRVALASILIHHADIVILDEPTNHIDDEMIHWLEDFLIKYKGSIIMVTHDRYFLDRVVNKIVEIDQGKLYEYGANYSQYLELKSQREDSLLASERKRQSLLRTELEWMQRGARARSTKQKARIERFEQLSSQKGIGDKTKLEINSVTSRLGKKTIEINHITKNFGDKQIVKDFEYIVLRDDRIGIVGSNGCGKSTLLKMIAGELEPDSGSIIIGDTVKIGFFQQECDEMDGSIKVIDYIRNIAEYVETVDGKITASQMLERFLFPSNLQWTLVNNLSGGERRRLYLLSILMEAPNILLLDEPTNDLDIQTLTILEDYIDHFKGAVVAVSHDRYFLDRVSLKLFVYENDKINYYVGNYSDYQEKRQEQETVQTVKKEKNYVKQREAKLKFTYNEQKEYDTIDEDISRLESDIELIEQDILANSSNHVQLKILMEKKEELENLLEAKMDRWVYLNDLAEKIVNQQISSK